MRRDAIRVECPHATVASIPYFLTDELLDEVLADPNNDDPRRVYADWLAERGDPRGEFIAVQCELARKFDFHLVAREQQLRREHGARWIAELGLTFAPVRCAYGSACQQVTFQRGFPERLDLRVDELVDLDTTRVPLRSFVVGACATPTSGG